MIMNVNLAELNARDDGDGPWRVQVGKDRGHYRTRYTLNSRKAAEFYYTSLNTHSGHKKRIVAPDGKVVARYISNGR
jgi:hypothetical protein